MNNSCIPIYVINLEDNKPRLDDVTKQLDALSLPFERIDAVAGRKLSADQINDIYDKHANKTLHHRNLTVGEIGCYLSHRKIWRMMVDKQIERVLILEDDIQVQPSLVECLKLIEASSGWDVLKVADFENVAPAATQQLNDNFHLVSYNKVPNRTMGYFITLSAAKRLLQREKIYRPVDVDFQFYSDFNISVCGLRPNCVDVSPQFGLEENSDIAKQNKGEHHNHSTFFRNLKYRYQLHRKRKTESYSLSQFKLESQ